MGWWCRRYRYSDNIGDRAGGEERAFQCRMGSELCLNTDTKSNGLVVLNMWVNAQEGLMFIYSLTCSRFKLLCQEKAYRAPIAALKACSRDTKPEGPIFGVATGIFPPALGRLASAIYCSA